MKPFYADYVNHALRFYARNELQPVFESVSDSENYTCVSRVLSNIDKADAEILCDIFRRKDTLADNIYEVSKERNLNQDVIWTMLSKVTYQIAKERGLL
ncbi:MAG: hypothetical protein WHF31_16225 [Candidatus Dehalobacter alkaniphilus]